MKYLPRAKWVYDRVDIRAYVLGAVWVLALFPGRILAQGSSQADTIILDASIAESNIWDAISAHRMQDPTFRVLKQEPAMPNERPPVLVHKNGNVRIDWTREQHIRYLMESIRQGLYMLGLVTKPQGLDLLAIHSGKDLWPKLRDKACLDEPGLKYWDLNGIPAFCPEK